VGNRARRKPAVRVPVPLDTSPLFPLFSFFSSSLSASLVSLVGCNPATNDVRKTTTLFHISIDFFLSNIQDVLTHICQVIQSPVQHIDRGLA